jgi:Mn2+/Fe2+ NRAMP family transporter
MNAVRRLLSAIGPGIFILGYFAGTGTGSVTSMAKAGAEYGMTLKAENRDAIDVVKTPEPLAGRLATALFVTGIVAAAVSSLFPT